MFEDVCNLNNNLVYDENNSVIMVDYHNNEWLKRYSVSCHWWSSDATSLHRHNFYEFFIVTSGEAYHEINNRTSRLHKGTLRLITPNDAHCIVSCQGNSCTHINLSVTVERLEAICSSLGVNLDELCDDIQNINLSVSELEFFIKTAQRVSLMQFNNDDRGVVFISEMLSNAVCIVYNNKLFSHRECPEWFTRTLEKIHSPEYYSCSADDIYRIAGFSAPVVIDRFKRYTGKTVVEYLKMIKINNACDMLKNTETSILEISNILGYASLSHFNRVFKEYIGITPALYRKENKPSLINF